MAYLAGSTPCCRIAGVANADNNSTFVIFLPSGTYRIAFEPSAGSPFAGEWCKDAAGFATATDVTVGLGPIQLQVDLTL